MSKPTSTQKKTAAESQGQPRTGKPKAKISIYQQRRITEDGKIYKQEATFEGRIDRRPVIFNLGKNLSTAHKTRIQRRIFLGFVGLISAIIAFVLIFSVININIIQPNQPIVTVNGKNIPQRDYRSVVAYQAQVVWNTLQQDIVRQKDLLKQQGASPAAAAAVAPELSAIATEISNLQTSFVQSTVDSNAIDQMIDDVYIQQGLSDFKKSDPKSATALTVTQKQIDDAYTQFGKEFPSGKSLKNFESQNGMSSNDTKMGIAMQLRRVAMSNYLQGLYVSPTRQVEYKLIHFQNDTLAKAGYAAILKTPSSWNDLAQQYSIDSDTKGNNGGDQGYVIQGQKDQGVEAYAFAANRKVGDTSGLIRDIGGTLNVVQIINIDPARAVSADVLTTLKGNALGHWATGKRDLSAKVPLPDSNKVTSPDNIPVTPAFVTFATTPTPVVTTP